MKKNNNILIEYVPFKGAKKVVVYITSLHNLLGLKEQPLNPMGDTIYMEIKDFLLNLVDNFYTIKNSFILYKNSLYELIENQYENLINNPSERVEVLNGLLIELRTMFYGI